MAINDSNINHLDQELQSPEDMRNCPTPLLDLPDLFPTENFNIEEIMNMDLLSDPTFSITPGEQVTESSHQFSDFTQHSNDIHLGDNFFSNSLGSILPAGDYVNETNFTLTTEFKDFNKTTTSINDSDKKKDKCMTRNAVLARQNREKKKTEQNFLYKKVEQLEEENASLKKKYTEIKDAYQNSQNRITYLEAIIQNLPQIVNLVEHMNKFPSNNRNQNLKE